MGKKVNESARNLTVMSKIILQVVIGRLDPFENGSCETKDHLRDDNIFSGFNISYSDMVRYRNRKESINKEIEMYITTLVSFLGSLDYDISCVGVSVRFSAVCLEFPVFKMDHLGKFRSRICHGN